MKKYIRLFIGLSLLVGFGNAFSAAPPVGAAAGEAVVPLLGHDDRVWAVAFSPDGRWVATASEDRTARIWDVETGKQKKLLKHDHRVSSVAFSPDGCWVATGSAETARIWLLSPMIKPVRWYVKKKKPKKQFDHWHAVRSVAFSSDSRKVVTGSDEARIWDVETGQVEQQFNNHDDLVMSVAISPDSRKVATGSGEMVRIWDVETGQVEQQFDHDDMVWAVAFSPDGRKVAGSGRTVRIWDVETGQVEQQFDHDDMVWAVAFSPDGSRVVTGSGEMARIWDVATGEEQQRFNPGGLVTSVAFSLDGRLMVTGSRDGTVRIWPIGISPMIKPARPSGRK